jgi:hypothetical protein
MLAKSIVFLGHACVLICDGSCDKAWGMQARPRRMLSEDEDDYVYLPDRELGTAPGPGKTEICEEGGDRKPSAKPLFAEHSQLMNRWCARQCERARMLRADEVLPDMDCPESNIKRSVSGQPIARA